MICTRKNIEKLWLNGLFILLLVLISTTYGVSKTAASSITQSKTAGPVTIQGHVTNEAGTPIEGVVLSVKWGDQESTSDLNGMFKIFNVNEGDTIIVKHDNYQLQEFTVEKSKVNYFINLKNGKNFISNVVSDYQKSELIDVQGKVSDETGLALANTVLIIKGTSHGTATDMNGQFKLLRTPVKGIISVSHVGYVAQEVTIEKNKSNYEIALKRVVNILDELVVVSYNSNTISSQISKPDTNLTNDAKKELIMIEQNPEFPGGKQAMFRFLGQNIRYPMEAAKAGIQGRIYITFTINENGSIRKPRIEQGLGSGIDEEALRVVLNMPSWIPAKQMGQTVSVDYKLPVNFQLETATPKPAEKK